jgi:predicted nuclease with TOPRIM domain
MQWDLKTATVLASLIGIGVSVGIIVGRYDTKFEKISDDRELMQSNFEKLESEFEEVEDRVKDIDTRTRVIELISGLRDGKK